MIAFLVKEAIRSNRRAKLSFLFSLSSTIVGLILIAVSVLSVKISRSLEAYLQNQFEIQVYLNEYLSKIQMEELRNDLAQMKDVRSVEFISKEKAAEKFVKETGENFRTILEYNPLPASFVVKTNGSSTTNYSSLVKKINTLVGVDEAIFPNAVYEKMLFYLKAVQTYAAWLGIFLSIVAFYVIFSTTRLIIESRKEEIETMKLVGGSLITIKLPLLLNGIFIGLMSAFIAIGFLEVSQVLIKNNFYQEVPGFLNSTIILLFLGPALGFISSLIASWKISLKL